MIYFLIKLSNFTKGEKVFYTHSDGNIEEVTIIKIHSEAEGGGITIFIPSTNTERQTIKSRLIKKVQEDKCKNVNGITLKLINNLSKTENKAKKMMIISRQSILNEKLFRDKVIYYPEIAIKKDNKLIIKIYIYNISSNILEIKHVNETYKLIITKYSVYIIEDIHLKEYKNVNKNYIIAKYGATTLNGKKKIKITPHMKLLDCFKPLNNLYVPEDVFNNMMNLGLSSGKPIKKVLDDWKLKNDGNGLYLGNGDSYSSNIIKNIEKNNIKYYETRKSIYFKR